MSVTARKSPLVLLWAAWLSLACSDAGSYSGGSTDTTAEGDGDGDGECVAPNVEPPEPVPLDPTCLADIPCVTDANCPSGYTCNAALEPPACAGIYCGAAGTPCSDSSTCSSELSCDQGICKTCDVCGDQCSVDFATNPEHCGCCDNPVPEFGSCVDGQPTCPADMADCEGTCLDVAIFEASDEHCGGCNQVCPDTTEGCSDGYCEAVAVTTPTSCDDVCTGVGLICATDTEHVAYYVGGVNDAYRPIPTCDLVPPATDTCDGVTCDFLNIRCSCTF